jgi:hypothetical protein
LAAKIKQGKFLNADILLGLLLPKIVQKLKFQNLNHKEKKKEPKKVSKIHGVCKPENMTDLQITLGNTKDVYL